MPAVFVSHATVDRPFVEELVEEILKGCGLSEQQIFASSIPGMGVSAGKDLLADVRAKVGDAGLVIAVVSRTYPTRPVCVAELGAAWGVVGKLHPVLVPGVERDALGGLFSGLKADYLNEEHTLDELAHHIEEATGARPASTASWTRKKKRWLRSVDGLAASLPAPAVVSLDKHDELRSRLLETEDALAEAEEEIRSLHTTVEALGAAKDPDEVAEILLPTDDIARFQKLQADAVRALRDVSPSVRQAIRCAIGGTTMHWPNKFEEPALHQEVGDAIADGHLVDNETYVELNTRFGVVRRATKAVRVLAHELEGESLKPEFFEWFEAEFDGPPELGSRAVWEQVFPRL